MLSRLSALKSLTYIGWHLGISACDSLTSLNGLQNLNYIGSHLVITSNPALTSLYGLQNLNHINGYLWVRSNSVLNSLSGLSNIAPGSITNLSIYENPVLPACDIQSICNYLASPTGPIEIYSNGTGCNTQSEVEADCQIITFEEQQTGSSFSFYPNPASDFLTIEIPAFTTPGSLSITSLNGQELIKRQISEPKTQIDMANLPRGVYFVRLTGDKMVQMQKFVKQ